MIIKFFSLTSVGTLLGVFSYKILIGKHYLEKVKVLKLKPDHVKAENKHQNEKEGHVHYSIVKAINLINSEAGSQIL